MTNHIRCDDPTIVRFSMMDPGQLFFAEGEYWIISDEGSTTCLNDGCAGIWRGDEIITLCSKPITIAPG